MPRHREGNFLLDRAFPLIEGHPSVRRSLCAIRSGVLRGRQPVQRVITEALVATGVFVIGDAPDVAVIARAQVEVIADGEQRLAGRRRRHVYGLQALVVTEGVGDPGKAAVLAADEAGNLAVRSVSSG